MALVVALVALYIDMQARQAVRAAYDKVEAAMDADKDAAHPLTAKDIHALLNRPPDAKTESGPGVEEVYRWRGALGAFRLTLRYSTSGTLETARIGDAPPMARKP